MVIFKIYNMSEQVKIFDNPEFGQVRTIEQENKVWFGATDIATALGYSNPRDAIVRHCKSAGVVNHDVGGTNRTKIRWKSFDSKHYNEVY